MNMSRVFMCATGRLNIMFRLPYENYNIFKHFRYKRQRDLKMGTSFLMQNIQKFCEKRLNTLKVTLPY